MKMLQHLRYYKNSMIKSLNSTYAKPLPGTERGSFSVTPPALSGKGAGGLGRMRKVSLLIKPVDAPNSKVRVCL